MENRRKILIEEEENQPKEFHVYEVLVNEKFFKLNSHQQKVDLGLTAAEMISFNVVRALKGSLLLLVSAASFAIRQNPDAYIASEGINAINSINNGTAITGNSAGELHGLPIGKVYSREEKNTTRPDTLERFKIERWSELPNDKELKELLRQPQYADGNTLIFLNTLTNRNEPMQKLYSLERKSLKEEWQLNEVVDANKQQSAPEKLWYGDLSAAQEKIKEFLNEGKTEAAEEAIIAVNSLSYPHLPRLSTGQVQAEIITTQAGQLEKQKIQQDHGNIDYARSNEMAAGSSPLVYQKIWIATQTDREALKKDGITTGMVFMDKTSAVLYATKQNEELKNVVAKNLAGYSPEAIDEIKKEEVEVAAQIPEKLPIAELVAEAKNSNIAVITHELENSLNNCMENLKKIAEKVQEKKITALEARGLEARGFFSSTSLKTTSPNLEKLNISSDEDKPKPQ